MTSNDLPSFLVVGPPRTGTSWLHQVLNPFATLPSPVKETRFFDLHFERGLDWYRRRFPQQVHGLIGEVAPTYFASEPARRNIQATIPHAKIVFIFRNPVERVLSLYRMKRAYGRFRFSLDEALKKDPELIASGLYWTQLADWQRRFPAQQLLVTTYDDLVSSPQAFLDEITGFIGMPRIQLNKTQAKRIFSSDRMTQPRSYVATKAATLFADWCKAKGLGTVVASVKASVLLKLFLGGGEPLPDVSSDDLHKLFEFFRPEVEGLEAVLGRELATWKIPMDPGLQYVPEVLSRAPHPPENHVPPALPISAPSTSPFRIPASTESASSAVSD